MTLPPLPLLRRVSPNLQDLYAVSSTSSDNRGQADRRPRVRKISRSCSEISERRASSKEPLEFQKATDIRVAKRSQRRLSERRTSYFGHSAGQRRPLRPLQVEHLTVSEGRPTRDVVANRGVERLDAMPPLRVSADEFHAIAEGVNRLAAEFLSSLGDRQTVSATSATTRPHSTRPWLRRASAKRSCAISKRSPSACAGKGIASRDAAGAPKPRLARNGRSETAIHARLHWV